MHQKCLWEMWMIGRLICASATLALLAGCASDAPPPPPPPVAAAPQAPAPTPAGAPSAFDGVYKVTESHGLAKNSHVGGCNAAMAPLRVTNGTAAMTWRGPTARGPVGSDGSVDLKGLETKVTGQIANGVFNGKVETGACVYTVTLTRS